jgi:hypothetical protein
MAAITTTICLMNTGYGLRMALGVRQSKVEEDIRTGSIGD